MAWPQWDLQAKLWTWQRFQQLIGAALVAVPAGFFLVYLARGPLPADFDKDISVKPYDHSSIDDENIVKAIKSCHASGVGTWMSDGPNSSQIANATLSEPLVSGPTAFERAALWQSLRIKTERERFLNEAEDRQNRARHNQLRILCLSAAAAFLVALRALASDKDADAPFRSLMKGALLPISILALLMPVLATAVSGIATFDADTNIVVRHVRTLAQLEQLHGRIAEDVTSDPYLCSIIGATTVPHSTDIGTPPNGAGVTPANLNACLLDRLARTIAWEQRHEQILNDATQTLAHAGDLPRVEKLAAPTTGDVCMAAFRPPTGSADAMNTTQKSRAEPL